MLLNVLFCALLSAVRSQALNGDAVLSDTPS